MASPVETTKEPSSKALKSLGRDEMNLAEFPITLLTDRVPKDQNEAIYQDEIRDELTGLSLTRKLTITAGNHGLTTAADDDVILSLIQLTKQKNDFTNRKVEFTRHELVQLLGWTVGGASYDRLLLSLKRWTSVFLQYENAWRDNRTKTWTTAGFHIIDKYEITDTRTNGDQLELMPSYIVWGEDIFESFQAGYLKALDYDLCMGLRNSTAKRMYRFLDKRFHHRPDWTFDLKEFAHEHVGLGRHYEGPAHLKRNLEPALLELESVGFLVPLPNDERYPKEGRSLKIRLISGMCPPAPDTAEQLALPQPEPELLPLVTELTKREVTKATAAELVQKLPADFIELKLDVFDWLIEKHDKRVAKSPAGYLVKSINDDYAQPKGFVSKADRQQREEARQAKERQTAADLRRQRELDASEQAEKKRIIDYWESLTPQEQAELDAAATAQADPEIVALETGAFKSFGQTLRRNEYIRQLLKTRQPEPV
jgi:hypothetical protein